jgi:cellulose biosynthesis protein BcsQ
MSNFPYVITVSSEKGGVGKTTLATNLAIFLKALHEDLPVTILSFDNHFTVDKMFAIPGQTLHGDVADLLRDVPAAQLLHTGQYGVDYIPSSTALADVKQAFRGSMVLAGLLACSDIPGILVIDTRPDLDILTRNALFAADRVIIPVKDMPSLENCRNIFSLFDDRGLDKKSLSLIPCLIDSRIKFDGPFKDQRSLLKAYAINRGYRCFDTYISKSPKVESLTTNPAGKVYPILTHARGTEVFSQFMQLGRTLLAEIAATPEPRSLLFRQWLTAEEGRKKEALFSRLEGLNTDCLYCGRTLVRETVAPGAYYYETSDDSARGFLDEECFCDFLVSAIYRINTPLLPDDPSRQMLLDAARDSLFVFRSLTMGNGGGEVEFNRFDTSGSCLSKKSFAWQAPSPATPAAEAHLYSFMAKMLPGNDGLLRHDAFLLVHPPLPRGSAALLAEENYRQFSRLKKHIASTLAS